MPPAPPVVAPIDESFWRRHWRGLVAVVVALVVSTSAAAVWAAQDVPYYAMSPGGLYPTTALVLADEDRIIAPEGEVLFTTVLLNDLTRVEQWILERDASVDIVDQAVIQGSRTPDENREFNARLMTDSKQVAILVALEHLGESVEIFGSGASVTNVVQDLPVASFLSPGDTVVAADGEEIALVEELVAAIDRRNPGESILLVVEDASGERREEAVPLAEREDEPGRPILGVSIETRDVRIEPPFDIDIDTGDVGGPSAGLAMTLAILEVLTEGELTGGAIIAVSGTIGVTGLVGPVGGVKQKAIAARRANVDLLLVPASEVDQARAHVGDVPVVGVEHLDDALAALEAIGGDPLPAA